MRIDPESHRKMIEALRRGGARGTWLRVVEAVLDLAGGEVEFLRHAEKRWHSATFSGTRHTVALAFTGPRAIAAGEAFIADLPDHEFAIAGQLVAEAKVLSVEHVALPEPRLELEAELLLLEEV